MQKMQGAIGANLVIFLVHHTQVVLGGWKLRKIQTLHLYRKYIGSITVLPKLL